MPDDKEKRDNESTPNQGPVGLVSSVKPTPEPTSAEEEEEDKKKKEEAQKKTEEEDKTPSIWEAWFKEVFRFLVTAGRVAGDVGIAAGLTLKAYTWDLAGNLGKKLITGELGKEGFRESFKQALTDTTNKLENNLLKLEDFRVVKQVYTALKQGFTGTPKPSGSVVTTPPAPKEAQPAPGGVQQAAQQVSQPMLLASQESPSPESSVIAARIVQVRASAENGRKSASDLPLSENGQVGAAMLPARSLSVANSAPLSELARPAATPAGTPKVTVALHPKGP